jgi:hypothetical protein
MKDWKTQMTAEWTAISPNTPKDSRRAGATVEKRTAGVKAAGNRIQSGAQANCVFIRSVVANPQRIQTSGSGVVHSCLARERTRTTSPDRAGDTHSLTPGGRATGNAPGPARRNFRSGPP